MRINAQETKLMINKANGIQREIGKKAEVGNCGKLQIWVVRVSTDSLCTEALCCCRGPAKRAPEISNWML